MSPVGPLLNALALLFGDSGGVGVGVCFHFAFLQNEGYSIHELHNLFCFFPTLRWELMPPMRNGVLTHLLTSQTRSEQVTFLFREVKHHARVVLNYPSLVVGFHITFSLFLWLAQMWVAGKSQRSPRQPLSIPQFRAAASVPQPQPEALCLAWYTRRSVCRVFRQNLRLKRLEKRNRVKAWGLNCGLLSQKSKNVVLFPCLPSKSC